MTPVAIGPEPRCFALVPCAGTGTRSGAFGPKQYAPVAGLPLVAHTLAALAKVDRLAATLVVLSPDDDQFDDEMPGFVGEHAWVARCGGASRAETVANGLTELLARGAQPHDWVLVHDAARCLVRPEWVNRLIDACADDEVGGLLALPVADTLKQQDEGAVAGSERAAGLVDRGGKWAAQTPQMFRLALLQRALAVSDAASTTDEAAAVQALGHQPRLVRGDYENLKVTWPGDFELAERLLATAGRHAEIRAFVPAKDFALSQAFYADLGFTREFAQGDLAGFRLGTTAFLLQNFHVPEHSGNFVMYLTLADLDAFWRRIERDGLAERYGVRIEAPEQRAWGRIDMTVTDPSGVLWRIAQRLEVA